MLIKVAPLVLKSTTLVLVSEVETTMIQSSVQRQRYELSTLSCTHDIIYMYMQLIHELITDNSHTFSASETLSFKQSHGSSCTHAH